MVIKTDKPINGRAIQRHAKWTPFVHARKNCPVVTKMGVLRPTYVFVEWTQAGMSVATVFM